MEFVIFSSNSKKIPVELNYFLDLDPFPYNRTGKIIDYLRNNCFEVDPKIHTNNALKQMLLSKRGKFGHFWDKPNLRDIYFYLDLDGETILTLSSVDIDILYRWRIAEYNGREFVIMEEKDPMVLKDINYHDLFRKREIKEVVDWDKI